ncbi:putative NUDIX hydrolase [Planctomycetes bacterium Poly30]|uniref:Putative NUDIX hydrolase n=1 Tax=Saltatorellus ferox TaxID=2528018 RepID=A0A518EN09_9BACT|nr:putative NUDIX hydrolase [Planctomycetes bacterium Poly30]
MISGADEAAVRSAIERLRGSGAEIPADAREAAVAVLLSGASLEDFSVLLMRRAFRETDPWSGQIGLPGGHAEEVDEDLIATARRESVEEVGIDPMGDASALHLGALPAVQATSRAKRLPLYITPIVFYRAEVEEPVCGPEADEAFWLPVRTAWSGVLDADHRYEHEGLVRNLPSWRFEDRTIWGMTHGILRRFFRAMNENSPTGE